MELALRAELPDGNDDARTLIATPSTRQSGLAEYLDGWRRRVERIGTANYPTELLGNIRAGRPTLEVVIAADGRLDDIVVQRSSGDKALDQAALKILEARGTLCAAAGQHSRRTTTCCGSPTNGTSSAGAAERALSAASMLR